MSRKRKKNRKEHSNNHLYRIMMVLSLCAFLAAANILYVMVTKTHLWSGHSVLVPEIKSSIRYAAINGARGTIYDRNHTVLAEEVPAYTILATFDPRTPEEKEKEEKQNDYTREKMLEQAKKDGTYEQTLASLEAADEDYVSPYIEDPSVVAKAIASVVPNTSEENILAILEKSIKDKYAQSELGANTKRISRAQKEELEAMKIPGLSFLEATTRNYPTTPMASNLLGYAGYDEEAQGIVGKMGLEMAMNDTLAGEDGLKTWQQSLKGVVLAGSTQTISEATDGKDVTLTLDAALQETVQQQMDITMKENNATKAWCMVMEVETGKILAWASYPTFDQNNPEVIPSFTDIMAEQPYEPGSVMKPFVYAAAIDAGVYPYNTMYRAGEFTYSADEKGNITRLENGSVSEYPTIRDALGNDYGTLTFEEGLAHSSNVAICELLSKYLDHDTFLTYLQAFGFGAPTGSAKLMQTAGQINMSEPSSYLSSGFGQATSVTVLELMQAYSAIFNDGVMMIPYVVDSISDPATGYALERYEPTVAGTPISAKTAAKVKAILETVTDTGMSGEKFAMENITLAAKTGTGEIYNPETGGYDPEVFTSSVMAAAPANDPKIMVYWGMQSANYIDYSAEPFQTIMQAALIADNISGGSNTSAKADYEKWESYDMPSLVNHTIDYAKKEMDGKKVNTLIIGDGPTVIDQFPKAGTIINSNDNVMLYTGGTSLTMPDLSGWTLKDLTAFWQLTGLPLSWSGYGKVTWQSVDPDTPVSMDTDISVTLE